MKKKVILGSLSAAALSALLLINGNTKVQAASDNSQHNSGNTTHEQAVDPIQAAQEMFIPLKKQCILLKAK